MEEEPLEPYEYEVDLRDYIMVVWENKWLILAITIVAVAAAFGFSFTQSPEYSTQTRLMFNPNLSEKLANSLYSQGFVSYLYSEETYKEIALADETVSDLHEKINSKTADSWDLKLEKLRESLSVDIQFLEEESSIGVSSSDDEPATDNPSENTILLEKYAKQSQFQFDRRPITIPIATLKVSFRRAKGLTEIADTWREIYSDKLTSRFSEEIERFYKAVSSRYEKIQKELNDLEENKFDYREKHLPEVLKYRIELLQEEYLRVSKALQGKRASLKGEKARRESLQSSLSEQSEYLTLSRTVSDENLRKLFDGKDSRDGDGANGNETLKDLLEFNSTEQVKNDLYFEIKGNEIDSSAEIEAIQKEINWLESESGYLSEKIEESQAELYRVNRKIEQYDREISAIEARYDSLRDTYELLKETRNSESKTVILEKATEAQKHETSDTRQNMAVAGVLGLFLGVLVAFFKNYMEGYETKTEAES